MAATKALEIDSSAGEAHIALALPHVQEYQWQAAGEEFRKGLTLSPSDAFGHAWYGMYLAAVGRPVDALREHDRALQLEPASPVTSCCYGQTLYLLRRHADAERHFRSALALDPSFPRAHAGLGLTYLQQRNYAKGIVELERAQALTPGLGRVKASLAYAYALSSTKDKAREILNEFLQLFRPALFPALMIAEVYIGLGDKDQAFHWLHRAIDQKDLAPFLTCDPLFDPLRTDSRFASPAKTHQFGLARVPCFSLVVYEVVADVCLFWDTILNQTGATSGILWCGPDTEVVSVQKLSMLAALSAAFLVSSTNAEIREADVTGGRVTGVPFDGVVSFKGIPFAAPPVGSLRWRSPQPVKPWTGVKQASSFAPGCIQNAAFTGRFGAPPALSEDCLYLNVWTAAKTTNDKLPVMVWIYGGAFTGGMTSIPTYDGTHLAQKGVVLVSVAYRLGAFGFLADPELTRENGDSSGDFGLEDMIASLKWVKNNVAKFGGDPSRVTIFGESAGGIAVSMLSASPAAKGLFQGAISESGGNFGPERIDNGAVEGGVNMVTLKMAEVSGHQFLEKLGANNIQNARGLSAEKIREGLGQGAQTRFWPVFDGKVLPGDQYELYEARHFNDTPVLIGTNSDEGASFARPGVTKASFEEQVRAGYGKQADAILSAYPHATDEEAMQSSRDLFRDSVFAWPTWAWASLQSQKGKGKAYIYYFDHKTPRTPHGAQHASEIGYVFHNLGGRGPAPEPENIAISDLMSAYWTNFAKNGNPNGPGLPEWPAFTEASQQVMYFDGHSGSQPVPNITQIKAMDAYFAWRREQARAINKH